MGSIVIFLESLAGAFDIPKPSVKAGTPIQGEAQYSPLREEIQYRDEEAMLMELSSGGSAAPLRWTLHEFAHHVQHQRGADYNEERARAFTEALTPKLHDAWLAATVAGDSPTIAIETTRYEQMLDGAE